MFQKTLIASALAAASLSAIAANYYVVVPVVGKPANVADLNVSLNAANLPSGRVGATYSYDFKNALVVTGDPTFSASLATFNTTSSLPAGMSLSSTGVLTGTPTVKSAPGGASFQVVASYKAKTGQQIYTLLINDTLLTGVSQIVTGRDHTCALVSGVVKCWGANTYGQLGDGTTTQRLTPVDVVGLNTEVIQVSSASDHTCALLATGGVKCWGYNAFGQLGDDSITNRLVPVTVSGASSGVASIAVGYNHTCLVARGRAKCWGSNEHGQLGNGTLTDATTPVAVSWVGFDEVVESLALGVAHTCALTDAGSVKCWGRNLAGQVGDGSFTKRSTPVDVASLSSGVTSLSAGAAHTCAVVAGGAKCWGYNGSGQLGNNSTANSSVPVSVTGLTAGVSGLGAGSEHSCAVISSGGVKCWGLNNSGQLGDGTTTDRRTPVEISALALRLASGISYSNVTGGGDHTCAMTSSGSVQCWGRNNSGQLGTNDATNRQVPTDVVKP